MKGIGSAACAGTDYGYTEDITFLPSVTFPPDSSGETRYCAASAAALETSGNVMRNVAPAMPEDCARLSEHPSISQIARATDNPRPVVPVARTAEGVGYVGILNG